MQFEIHRLQRNTVIALSISSTNSQDQRFSFLFLDVIFK
jgi:hypothetical protein